MPERLRAFHGDQSRKDKYLSRVRDHIKNGQLIRNLAWNSKVKNAGSSTGCIFHCENTACGPIDIGYPEEVVLLHEDIMLGLPDNVDFHHFPIQFLDAAKTGSDLSLVWPKFAVWILREGGPCYIEEEQDYVVNVRCLFELFLSGRAIDDGVFQSTARIALADYEKCKSEERYYRSHVAQTAGRTLEWFGVDYSKNNPYGSCPISCKEDSASESIRIAARAVWVAAAQQSGEARAGKNAAEVFWIESRDKLLQLLADCNGGGG